VRPSEVDVLEVERDRGSVVLDPMENPLVSRVIRGTLIRVVNFWRST
jgi:hypothetical protein